MPLHNMRPHTRAGRHVRSRRVRQRPQSMTTPPIPPPEHHTPLSEPARVGVAKEVLEDGP